MPARVPTPERVALGRVALAADGLGRGRDARCSRRSSSSPSTAARQRSCATRSTGARGRRERALPQPAAARPSDSPHALAAAATRYVHDQPFGASSTLLFAVVPGAGTEHQPARAARPGRPRQRRDASPSRTRRTASAQRCSRSRRVRDRGLPRCRRPASAQAPRRASAATTARHDRRRRAAGGGAPAQHGDRAGFHPRRARWRSPPRCWPPTWSARASRCRCGGWRRSPPASTRAS